MTFRVTPAPSFLRDLKVVMRRYGGLGDALKDYFSLLEIEGPQGDKVPRFSTTLWKDRLPLTQHRIGKSGGLRIVYLCRPEHQEIIPLFIYCKKDKADFTVAELRKALRELQE